MKKINFNKTQPLHLSAVQDENRAPKRRRTKRYGEHRRRRFSPAMRQRLGLWKSFVWPHYNNSWQPYLLRAPALALAALAMVVLIVGLNLGNQTGQLLGVAENITESELLELTNTERVSAGLEPLQVSDQLSAAAAAKARDMFAQNYWAHNGPNNATPWRFIKNSGYDYQYAGENLAKNFQTSNGVMAGWLKSEGHRQNLLEPAYRDIGLAVVDGKLNGTPTTLVVALYGQSRSAITNRFNLETRGEVLPSSTSYSIVKPLNVFAAMPPASQIIGLLCLGFAGLYMTQHLVVRRRQLLWDSHIHPHPALQAVLFFGLVVMLVQASFGAVA